jgi:hypothetical protein
MQSSTCRVTRKAGFNKSPDCRRRSPSYALALPPEFGKEKNTTRMLKAWIRVQVCPVTWGRVLILDPFLA